MQNEHMSTNTQPLAEEAAVVAAAFGVVERPAHVPLVLFAGARAQHPDHAVCYCSQCAQVSTIAPEHIPGMLQMVAVPPDTPDESVPTGHDIPLPQFNPASQYIHAHDACFLCASDEAIAIARFTIESPVDVPTDETQHDE